VSLLIACLIHHLIPYSAKIGLLTSEDRNLAEDTFKRFGPVPRICIDYVRQEELPMYEARCRAAASHITAQSLRPLGDLDIDAELHKIFMVRRNKVDDLREAYVEPISPYVEMLLMRTIDKLQPLDRIALHRTLACIDSTRMVAGLFFRSLGHMCFVEGVALSLKSMTKTKARSPSLCHWKSQGERVLNSMDLDDSDFVFFPPLGNPAIVFEDWPTSVPPNYLYIPRANNQMAFESFFLFGTTLYFVQFTMSDDLDIINGIEKDLSGQLDILPPKENWCFVFITPPGCEVNVKATAAAEEF
jgi:hypothetical protein